MSERINKLLADLQIAVREEVGAAMINDGDKTTRLGALMRSARKDARLSLQDGAERPVHPLARAALTAEGAER